MAEFRALVERQVTALGSKQLDALKKVRHVEVTLVNLQDSKAELEEALRVETGALMQVRGPRMYRRRRPRVLRLKFFKKNVRLFISLSPALLPFSLSLGWPPSAR